MAGSWVTFFLMLLPLPALVLHAPLWIEQLFAVQYPVHLKGIAVVTGASSGIGRHVALSLDRGGMTVFAAVRSSADADKLLAERPSIRALIWDVTSQAQTDAAVDAVRAAMDAEGLALAGVVNNAGISHRLPLELDELDDIRALFEVNLFGALRVTQAFIPLLRRSSGRVVFVGSVAGLIAQPGSAAYSGSKAAIELTADALRLELAPWQISVSVVEPAYVRTAIAAKQTGPGSKRERASAHASAELYAETLKVQDAKRLALDAKGDSPVVTSTAIAHALAAARPRTRYVVANVDGKPAWLFVWLAWLLPDRVQDLLVLSR
jgi:NAD(P)-dependent dehydrogenase (short-subunit alcohol dehydrogenase family)